LLSFTENAIGVSSREAQSRLVQATSLPLSKSSKAVSGWKPAGQSVLAPHSLHPCITLFLSFPPCPNLNWLKLKWPDFLMMALAWLDRHELLLGQQLARLESQESKLANPLLLSINKEQETTFLQLPLSQVQIPERSRLILALLPIISRTFIHPRQTLTIAC
jgi:hypothetical protein